MSVQTGEQLAEKEQHQATIPSVLETRKNKYFKSFSKGGRPGVCLLLLLSRSLYHLVSYPSMGLWRWFSLWALFQHPSVHIQPPLNSLTCIQTKPVSLWSGSEITLLCCSFGRFGSGVRGMPAHTMPKTKQSLSKLTECIRIHLYKDGYSST